MNRLWPAETRLKEGANARDWHQTGGNVPLPRVGGALSARSRQYQGTAASMSNAARDVETEPAGIDDRSAGQQLTTTPIVPNFQTAGRDRFSAVLAFI
jgi:hypothetical protein